MDYEEAGDNPTDPDGTYANEETAAGDPGASYSTIIAGLTPFTWYYARAKAYLSSFAQWIYGVAVAFQTLISSAWTKFDEFTSAAVQQYVTNQYRAYSCFTPTVGHVCKAIELKLSLSGNPGDGIFYASLYETSGGKPTGTALVTASMPTNQIDASPAWYGFYFEENTNLAAGTEYAIVCYATVGTYSPAYHVEWYRDSNGESGGRSQDYGVNWVDDGKTYGFKEYGVFGLETYPATDIESFEATGWGFLLDMTGITEFGFDWGTESGVYTGEVTESGGPFYEGTFALVMEDLDHTTTYFFRAKAYHPTYGWVYANELSFTTLPPRPKVDTEPPSGTGDHSITPVGNITDEGAVAPTRRGFVYGLHSVSKPSGATAPGDTSYEGYVEETGTFSTGEFSIAINNLEYGRKYYYRAYAYNDYGYAYGAELMALTSDTVNILYATSDSSKGIRFAHPGGDYPHPYQDVDHYKLVRDADGGYVPAGEGAYGFGYVTGSRVYERQYYNPDYFSDLYGMSNPTRRTGTVIKVKWKAQLLNNGYAAGGGYFWRLLYTHSALYTGADPVSGGAPDYMVCELFYNNPNTSSPWTIDECDNVLLGIKIYSGSGFETPSCCALEGRVIWANAAVRTDPSTMYIGTAARLNGYVLEDEAEACEVYFEWGETDAYGNETTHQTDKAKHSSFYADVSELDPEILYHYRAVIVTACGETFYGDDMVIDYDYGALILEQAFGQSILTVEPEWTDITQYLRNLNIKRGRQHELGRTEAGTAVFVLNNAAGHFWRNNTAGDYYPNVKPLTLTRLRYRYGGVYYPVYYGVSESYLPSWESDRGGFTPIMELGCVDMFKSFSRYRLVDANPKLTAEAASGQKVVYVEDLYGLVIGQSITIYDDDNAEINYIAGLDYATLAVTMEYNLTNTYSGSNGYLKKFPAILSGLRIRDILLEAWWPEALMSLDAGQFVLAELSPGASGTNILDALQKSAEAEGGNVFQGPDGVITFQDSAARTASPYNTSQATFKDDDNNSKYIKPALSDDDTYIYNEANISGPAIGEQTFLDDSAQGEQGPRTLTRSDSQLQYASDAAVQAFIIVERFNASKFRCKALHIIPNASQADLFPKVLGYDISTRITLQLNSARNPAMLDADYHIEGTEHQWDARTNQWLTKWELWDINQYRHYAALHDGYMYNRSLISYDDCHDAASCSYTPFNDHGTLMVGQRRVPGVPAWDIMRGLLEIDTTELLSSATVLEAYLLIYFQEVYADRLWYLTVVNNNGVDNPLIASDYGALKIPTTSRGAVNGAPPIGWRTIQLSEAGIAEINKEGITRFALRNTNDIGAIEAPDPYDITNEYAIIGGVGEIHPVRLVVRLL